MRRTSREGRIGFFCHKLKPLAKLYEMWIYLVHNSFIPAQCEIGEGTSFGYKGIGVVIHKRAKIGKNCVIAQGVTIGGRSGHYEVPVIGDNCYIGVGAKVLGPAKIGNNVTIGANAVMMKDAPDETVWGLPQKCCGIKTASEWDNASRRLGRCAA